MSIGAQPRREPVLGVVIVAYNGAGFIADCLESLLAARQPGLRIVVVDNGSRDDTAATVRAWASGAAPLLRADWPFGPAHRAPRPIDYAEFGAEGPPIGPLPQISLIRTGANRGFAGGVNRGLRALLADPEIDLLWVLNPDTLVPPATPAAFIRTAQALERFAVIGGRIVFSGRPDRLQSDGGRLARFTRAVQAINFGARLDQTPPPDPASLDFISGACMVASRAFIARAGMMDEGYFLYFEEIDWQLRRGDLPLGLAGEAIVLHRAGASIGSGGPGKPSALAAYFTHRALLRFVARWYPLRLPLAYGFAWLRMLRQLDGSGDQLCACLAGLHHLPPPHSLRPALAEDAWSRALSRRSWLPRGPIDALLHRPGIKARLRALRPLYDRLVRPRPRHDPTDTPERVLAEIADRLVVLLSFGRSGSTVLGEFLASHPDVVTLGEVLNEDAFRTFHRASRRLGWRPSHARQSFYPWLREQVNRHPGKRVLIDLKFESLHLLEGTWHLPGHEFDFIERLAQSTLPVILLERRDHAARFRSHERAQSTGRFHSFQPAVDGAEEIQVDGERLRSAVARTQAQLAATRARLAGRRLVLDLAYEDLFEQHDGEARFARSVVEQVSALLALPPLFDCRPRLKRLSAKTDPA